jgi:uncharacterized membrane protein
MKRPTRNDIHLDISITLAGKCTGEITTAFWTHLHILQTVLLANTPQDVLLAALLHLARQQQFIQDEVRLLEIENDIQLAYVAVVLVHLLDISVHDLKGDQLVIGRGASGDEEERGISAVDDFGVCRRQ